MLANLFRKKPAPEPHTEEIPLHSAINRSLLFLIEPQLGMLGIELGEVPVEGNFTTKRSRGYVFGIASGVLGNLTSVDDLKVIEYAMQSAFTFVYGPDLAETVYLMTLQESGERDGEMLAGSYRAESDVQEIYSGKPFASVMGFWLLNNGLNDPEDIMPAITHPRSLP